MSDHAALYLTVHWTARLAALLFSAALAAPVLFRLRACRREELYLAFILALAVHFAFVTWLALATGGAQMFPGGKSVAEVGGWPVVFGIFAFCQTLAWVGFAARRTEEVASRGLHVAGSFSRGFIGVMFVGTYLPLVAQSWWYLFPATLVVGAVSIDAMAGRLRQLRCFGSAGG
jgi:hypothetical protein